MDISTGWQKLRASFLAYHTHIRDTRSERGQRRGAYGTSTVTGNEIEKLPTKNKLETVCFQGRLVAEITKNW